MRETAKAGMTWTGHPLVDMGTATLVAFSERARPEDITLDDLALFAKEAESALFTKALRSHASVLFTSNAPYLQPSFTEERRRQKAGELLRAHQTATADDATCAYCGRAAVSLETDSGRAYRELIPLLTGQGVVNFFPGGQHGLSVCGRCLTSLQALPLGAPSCEGRALIVASDDPSQVVALVKAWLPDLLARAQLSAITGEKVDTWRSPRTRLVERLVELQRQRAWSGDRHPGFTVYHLSNSGQGPGLRIFFLPASVVHFVRLAQAGAHQRAWHHVARRRWLDDKRKPRDQDPAADERLLWRNTFYEELFDLPERAPAFVARYFLGTQRASIQRDRTGEHIVLWDLVALFLREVLGMESERIDAIRALGDGIADEVTQHGDRRLFPLAFRARGYDAVRTLLTRTSTRRIQRGDPPLLDFDGFLTVFDLTPDAQTARTGWRLPWDLTLIRVIDQLHAREWYAKHPDAVTDLPDIEDDDGEGLPDQAEQ
jgi:CRISPR-associated protein Cst1